MTENERTAVQIRTAEIYQEQMDAIPDVKTLTIGGSGQHGPITLSLQLPVVTITDATGRSISIPPNQADVVAEQLNDLGIWLQEVVDRDEVAP